MKENNKRFIDSIEDSVKSGNRDYVNRKCGLLSERNVSNDDMIELLMLLIRNKKYLILFFITILVLLATTLTVITITGILTAVYSILLMGFPMLTSATICLALFITAIIKFDKGFTK